MSLNRSQSTNKPVSRCIVFCWQVTGIDGNYRMTCESVLDVLRDHRDSVMAVLEAFVYDPLLNWRLMDGRCYSDSFDHPKPVYEYRWGVTHFRQGSWTHWFPSPPANTACPNSNPNLFHPIYYDLQSHWSTVRIAGGRIHGVVEVISTATEMSVNWVVTTL